MPLYGGGNLNKRKGTRRGKGNEQKSGMKGVAAQYITRNKAIRKLQISLKDFRRLCILKGIYPRDPRKKKEGKDKTYYHVKDIQYLHHEPLLVKFRELKIFLKKYKKAISRRDHSRAKVLEENKPVFSLAHLIKERYPTFQDALADLDDPISMCHLFSALPAQVLAGKNQHTPEKAFDCEKLADEFSTLVVHTHALRKVFVSIKGIYYQAKIQGVDITWLVPHQFNQVLPDDVDYRVMLTFLQFYAELLRFVNLKLYHDQGLNYPPTLDQALYERRGGLKSIQVQAKATAVPEANVASAEAASTAAASSATTAAAAPVDSQAKKALQKSVTAVVNKLKQKGKKGGAKAAADAMEDVEAEDESKETEAAADADDFAALNGADPIAAALARKTPAELDAYHAARVFEGLTFLLSREVPHGSLEFVILCGGGKVESERGMTEADASAARFTHQIVDRPVIKGAAISSREYIQPQWIYDSFNSYHVVPVSSYAPGVVPPPHLSPFVKEEEEAELEALPAAGAGTVYVPKQRAVLQSWGAKASWLQRKQSEFDAAAQNRDAAAAPTAKSEEDAVDAELEAQEAKHARELALERKGKSHSAHVEEQQQKKAAAASTKKGKKAAAAAAAASSADAMDEDDAADESEGEGDIVPDSEDEDEENGEDDEDAEEAAPVAAAASASSRKRKAAAPDANDPEELAKAMMTKKNKRLHTRMMYGINKKQEAVEKLHEKREAAEKEEKKAAKKQKTASTKKQ